MWLEIWPYIKIENTGSQPGVIYMKLCYTDYIVRTHGCVQNDSETHETVLLDCTTGKARSAIQ